MNDTQNGNGSPNLIVHLCPRVTWDMAQGKGEYQSPSLEMEGFIHCSAPEQVLQIANAFYRGKRGLALLWINTQQVQPEIRWETADVPGEVFPHIYGSLNLDAVIDVWDFTPNPDGSFYMIPTA